MSHEDGKPAVGHIDQVCDAFEKVWQSGQRPVIDDFLGDASEPDRTRLLQELLGLEIEYRVQRGERPSPAEYLARFPGQVDVITAVFRKPLPPAPVSPPLPAEAPTAPGLILTVTAGPHVGRIFTFSGHDTFLVGRSRHAHFQLAAKDRFFSRIHFMVECNPPLCRLSDMRSRNGTFVNGQLRSAIRVICQVLEALEYAHAHGFVHRDIKPSNILIGQDGGQSAVKVADFGLARVYQASQLSGLTIQGEVGGTCAFIPPEQVTNFRTVQPAADQYASAATLYYLLTGQYMYDFKKTPALPLVLIVTEDAVPIEKRRSDLPSGLCEAIRRATAREPKSRFPNVAAFRQALLPFGR